ncbi:MAG TPA: DUF4160 domain-containing protein [Planctomycetota bacterium]|nr:DUF4160 domain-containing protein [Planctomycetota bacterium]
MPTVLREGPYRFYFFSDEREEPAHVHVDRDRCSAKFWLDPIALAHSRGFAAHERHRIRSILEDHRFELLEAWHDFFEG